jgi:hypothetical protein
MSDGKSFAASASEMRIARLFILVDCTAGHMLALTDFDSGLNRLPLLAPAPSGT